MLEIKKQIQFYTERVKTIKENISNEIDTMTDTESRDSERELRSNVEFIRSLKKIQTEMKGIAWLTAIKPKSPIDGSLVVDGFEIHPVALVETGGTVKVFEQCEENDTNIALWSVYVHYKGGGLDCIIDCETKEEAIAAETFLKELCVNYKP